MVDITVFNALPEGDAEEVVSGCLGVHRWVREVVDGRPYVDTAALAEQARVSALDLSDDELTAALSRHPRIGERPGGAGAEATYSRTEQAGVDPADEERLRKGNAAYENRFGHVFLIRAAGRSSAEILSELERRLGNDAATERGETVAALRDIALLRLGQVVA